MLRTPKGSNELEYGAQYQLVNEMRLLTDWTKERAPELKAVAKASVSFDPMAKLIMNDKKVMP